MTKIGGAQTPFPLPSLIFLLLLSLSILLELRSFKCSYVITIHQRHRQTDRQTTCDRNTALCTKVHRAVIKKPCRSQSIGLSCRYDTGTLYTPKPTNIVLLKTALLSIWNDVPQFTDKAVLSFRNFEIDFMYYVNHFYSVLLQLADTLNSQVKYREGS